MSVTAVNIVNSVYCDSALLFTVPGGVAVRERWWRAILRNDNVYQPTRPLPRFVVCVHAPWIQKSRRMLFISMSSHWLRNRSCILRLLSASRAVWLTLVLIIFWTQIQAHCVLLLRFLVTMVANWISVVHIPATMIDNRHLWGPVSCDFVCSEYWIAYLRLRLQLQLNFFRFLIYLR